MSDDQSHLTPEQRALLALRRMKVKLDALEYAKSEPIAIIGIGCRFPGGANQPEAFWQMLRNGQDAITEVPADRWNINDFYDPDPDASGKMCSRWGGFLEKIELFDPYFFGIAPREAVNMDPQQRLLLEVTWEALEHAGQVPGQLAGTAVGVFLGASSSEYGLRLLEVQGDTTAGVGNACSMLANRLSYQLDLQGPCVVVDTACSSSLVAVHLACQALRNRECTLAIAGGVNLILLPEPSITFSKAHMLSTDGRCKTFDARANGFVRGEGCGTIVLKRLSDAEKAGDHILALIRGSAVNQDGHSTNLTAPNKLSQEAVIRRALEAAHIKPEQISYVEAHGTGTALGDPIEVEALTAAIGQTRTPDNLCWLGSVKTNIGHLEAAAGMAGLIKTVLALQHKEIPPHLHFHQLNPHILFEQTPFVISTALTAWAVQPGQTRLAGVSSFGMGGTNAHIILEESTLPVQTIPELPYPFHLLCLSAQTPGTLSAQIQSHSEWLMKHTEEPLEKICSSTHTQRTHFAERLALVASDHTHLQKLLTSALTDAEMPLPQISRGQVRRHRPKIAFLFTGQGAQYSHMSLQLYEISSVYRQSLDECVQIFDALLDQPLLSVLFGAQTHLLDETQYTQPALFAIEYALAQLWKSWGIEPDIVLGHSVGEYVAACIAGLLSLADGARLIAARGKLMQAIEPAGTMLAVQGDINHVQLIVEQMSEDISIAAYNGPQDVVIAGRSEAITEAREILEARGNKTRLLQVSQAFHSPLMDEMMPQWEALLKTQSFLPLKINLISNVSGRLVKGNELGTIAYWKRQVREPVQFEQSIQTLRKQGVEILLELGPQPTLSGMGKKIWSEQQTIWIPTLRKGKHDWEQMLQAVGQLHVTGVEINWDQIAQTYPGSRPSLPTYPFQRQRYWVDIPDHKARSARVDEYADSSDAFALPGKQIHSPIFKERVFEKRFSLATLPFLAEHTIHDLLVVPAVAYLEMVLGALITTTERDTWQLVNVVFYETLVIPSQQTCTVQLILTSQESESTTNLAFQIFSLSQQQTKQDPTWILHATGKALPAEAKQSAISLRALQAQCLKPVPLDSFYQKMNDAGFLFGPRFKSLQQLWQSDSEVLGEAVLAEQFQAESLHYHIYPPQIDACFQVSALARMFHLEKETLSGEHQATYVPLAFDRITFYQKPGKHLWSSAQMRPENGKNRTSFSTDLRVFNEMGELLIEAEGFHFKAASHKALQGTSQTTSYEQWFHHVTWQAQTQAASANTPTSTAGTCLLFTNDQHLNDIFSPIFNEHSKPYVAIFLGDTILPKAFSWDYSLANFSAPSDFQTIIQKACSGKPPCQNILFFWKPSKSLTPYNQSLQICTITRTLLQTLANFLDSQPRLWLLTKGVHHITAGETRPSSVDAIIQSTQWGLGRTLALEYPALWGGLIDLDPGAITSKDAFHILMAIQQIEETREDQIALRDEQRYVARLQTISINPVKRESMSIHEHGTYLITGGLGGLGLQIARWLVSKGARSLLLISRREAGTEHMPYIDEMRGQGAQVLTLTADISQEAEVQRIFATSQLAHIAPVRGIVHAAGVLEDGLFLRQTTHHLEKVFAPKIAGAWYLHQQTQALELDWFVLFSSSASLLGSSGQGSYSAANAFLDSLATYRRSLGLPALSINWGPWSEVGMAAEQPTRGDRLADQGLPPIAPQQGVKILELLLQSSAQEYMPACVAILPIEWEQLFHANTRLAGKPLLRELHYWKQPVEKDHHATASQVQHSTPKLVHLLQAVKPAERFETACAYVLETTQHMLGFDDKERIDIQKPLSEYGLDSIMALNMAKAFETVIEKPLPATLLFDQPTIHDLTTYLLTCLSLPLEETVQKLVAVEKNMQEEHISRTLENSSTEDIIALLAKELENH